MTNNTSTPANKEYKKNNKTKEVLKKNSFGETFKSVGSAFIGVQSNKNRERDFAKGKASHFIIAGVIATILFIGVLITIVSYVLPS